MVCNLQNKSVKQTEKFQMKEVKQGFKWFVVYSVHLVLFIQTKDNQG